ncbi:hypothetical protein ACFE04_015348 [Oxalis oulophora]
MVSFQYSCEGAVKSSRKIVVVVSRSDILEETFSDFYCDCFNRDNLLEQRRYDEECPSLFEYRGPKFMIGDGNNIYDFTYVENVAHAHAHVCAERALASEEIVAKKAAGQAYFITNMEPIKFWEIFSRIVEGFGYERPRIKIPANAAMPIAHEVELAYKSIGPYGMPIPQIFFLKFEFDHIVILV